MTAWATCGYPKASFSCPPIAVYHIFVCRREMGRWVLNHQEKRNFIRCSWFSSDLGHLLESWPYSIISALIPSASCGQSKPNDPLRSFSSFSKQAGVGPAGRHAGSNDCCRSFMRGRWRRVGLCALQCRSRRPAGPRMLAPRSHFARRSGDCDNRLAQLSVLEKDAKSIMR